MGVTTIMPAERLQKILARAGVASRRKAERMIQAGHVTINGRVVTEMGVKADPARDAVAVDGHRIQPTVPGLYLVLNKPDAVMTTREDPEGRRTVYDLIGIPPNTVFSVGRLDYHSEGLLLFTNDGAMAHRLMHPSAGVPKTYLVKVKGSLTDEEITRLEAGTTAPCRVKKVRKTAENSWIEVTLHEGKKRQIRRMLERVRHPVLRLIRTRYGPLSLKDLPAGRVRPLAPAEIDALRRICSAPTNAGRSPKPMWARRSA